MIGESASDIVSLIPSFDCLLAGFRVEAVAFSGGIWLFWEASKVNLEVLAASSQLIHALLHMNNDDCLLTAVYGSPHPEERKGLWDFI